MVHIPAGTFTRGDDDEDPPTVVTIGRGFWMGKYEVTQGEYLAVMGNNPSWFTGDLNRPVEGVSWNDATNYCAQLTALERAAGRLPARWAYRLPTEAQWEYACRAGTTTPFHYGMELRSGMANFAGTYEYLVDDNYHYNPDGIYLGRTTAVGSYAPNPWGLYDMHGNVWEWCQDWASPPGSDRVFRGGDWSNNAFYSRSASRDGYPAEYWNYNLGFRVVLAPGQP